MRDGGGSVAKSEKEVNIAGRDSLYDASTAPGASLNGDMRPPSPISRTPTGLSTDLISATTTNTNTTMVLRSASALALAKQHATQQARE